MKLNQKRFNSLRQGRISARKEARQQTVLRNNLEKRLAKRLNTLFRKFINVQMYLYKEFGIYEREIAVQSLNEDLFPLMLNHYRKIFLSVYKYNENKYFINKKAEEAFVFGRSVDFEELVSQYFNTKQVILTGISIRMANRIAAKIEEGRYAGLTLENIANLVSKEMPIIAKSRAALIARTETHNAASFANHSYHTNVQNTLGIKMVKKWVATNDIRTRSAHSAVSGQVVDMNEDFNVGGVPMSYAGDSKGGVANVINCRCVIVYADEQDVVLD